MLHCIELLRQAIRCNADPTLDPVTVNDRPDGTRTHSSLGWGGLHVCGNYDALKLWTEDRRYNDAGEGGGGHELDGGKGHM